METTNLLSLGMLGLLRPVMMIALLTGVIWMLFGGMKNPLLWVILSVLLIIVGVGCLVFGVTDLIGLYAHRGPTERPSSYELECAASFVGGGAGGAVGGAVLLIVALLRQRKASGSASKATE